MYKSTMSAAAKIHSDDPDVPASEALFSQLSKVTQLLPTVRRHPEHQTRTKKRAPGGEVHQLHQLQSNIIVLLSQMVGIMHH